MGLLAEFARGVANATGNGLLARLCRENGWNIDERHGDAIALYFKGDRVSPRRTVYVTYPEGKAAMVFTCPCRAEFSARSLPDDLLGAMLLHNDDVTLGGWAAKVDDGSMNLCLQYTGMTAGMNAANFKAICTLMVKEVADVEANLHRKGLM